MPALLIAKSKDEQTSTDLREKFQSSDDDEIGATNNHFEVVKLKNSGFALLRLVGICGLFVARDEFCAGGVGLADVIALVARKEHPPLVVYLPNGDITDCSILQKAQHIKNSIGMSAAALQACAIKSENEHKFETTKANAILTAALEEGWTAPDGQCSKKELLNLAAKDVVANWSDEYPALAIASLADALGWLAYTFTKSNNRQLDTYLPVGYDLIDQITTNALAWALEETDETVAQNREQCIAPNEQKKVAIVYAGDGADFQNLLRGLFVIDPADIDGAVYEGPTCDNHGFDPLLKKVSDGDDACVADSSGVRYYHCKNFDDAQNLLQVNNEIIAISVPQKYHEETIERALKLQYTCIDADDSIKEILKNTMSQADSFAQKA